MNNKYFTRNEFSCTDQCGFNAVDVDLLDVLVKIREEFGPVIMHCACRCKKRNDEAGSKDSSQHLRGLAADFHIHDVSPDKIAYFADELLKQSGGIGIYSWGCHIDVREKKARWDHRE